MKLTKAALERLNKELEKLNDEKYYKIINLEKDKEKLEKDLDSLKSKIKNLIDLANSKADFILNILKIISGEAKPISKYEVIRDMFSAQLKSMKEKPVSNMVYNNEVYASDKINDFEYSI